MSKFYVISTDNPVPASERDEDDLGSLFWSQETGFGSLAGATVYSEEDTDTTSLPIADDQPMWTELPARNGFNPWWEVTVGTLKPLVIGQFNDRFEANEYLKVMRRHYSTKATLRAHYLGVRSMVNPPEDIVMKGTRRSL